MLHSPTMPKCLITFIDKSLNCWYSLSVNVCEGAITIDSPVWIPKINDEDIVELIKFAKENKFNLAIQKYETYRYSRKVKKGKKVNYWKFYKQLENWEKEFGIKLKFTEDDPTILRRKGLPLVFDINEKVQVIIVSKGWFDNQVIAKAKDRCITVLDCNGDIGNKISVKIIENTSNIYIAKLK